MPAPKMLSGLPKPVLFGLYGAIGGLIGALVFGELIMWALEPKKADAATSRAQLAVTASKDIQLYQGGANKLFVQILRDEFEGEVTLRVDGLPSGVTAPEVTIPANQTEAEIELRAAYTVKATTSTLTVVASAKPGGQEVSATDSASLTTLVSAMPQADIVFVLDVTGSMGEQIRGLQNGIGTFAADLYRAKVDARFGCVAFRDLFYRETQPDIFPQMVTLKFKGETFTSDAGAFRDEVSNLQASGGDDVPETSLEAISEAAGLKDWRPSATRVLVLITDAPPKLNASPPRGQSIKATVDSLQANKIDLLHLVTGNKEPRVARFLGVYREVQQGAIGINTEKGVDKGKEFDLIRTAENAKAFTDVLLPEMTKAIVAAAETKRPEAKPEVTKKPEMPVIKAVQSSESYDKAAAGQLVLAVGVWTGAISALVCLMLLGGQHHYLRGTLPTFGGVIAALVGGLVVGLVGGAAGQGLVILANVESQFLLMAFRLLGWIILGALAGAGLSLFVPNLKPVYGLAGGAVGGAIGGIGYLVIERAGGDLVGRLAGGLVLGLCIGLMVAVVEAAFRRAWLEVRYGPREVVTVNLGAEPVKIGGDARSCTVWARGAADVALRYFIRDGKVICTDVPARAEEVVADGDMREAGNVTVVVRTGSGTAPTSAVARPTPPPIPKAKPIPAPVPATKPMELDAEEDVLPLPASSSSPVPPRPTSQPPAIKPTARDPDACPGCGRKHPGRPGTRYCMVCDQTY